MKKPINIHQGWLSSARRVSSPNANARPVDMPINLLVIHNISLPPEQFENGYIEEFFTNQLDATVHPYFAEIADLAVSAHLLITRSGEVIQFVPFTQRAWHAGKSCFRGREECNDFSIGIELEGADAIVYTDAQYVVLAQVATCLMAEHPEIIIDTIVGHSDIAPGRKTDPGESFDWPRFQQLLKK
jgi:AmpD protein